MDCLVDLETELKSRALATINGRTGVKVDYGEYRSGIDVFLFYGAIQLTTGFIIHFKVDDEGPQVYESICAKSLELLRRKMAGEFVMDRITVDLRVKQ